MPGRLKIPQTRSDARSWIQVKVWRDRHRRARRCRGTLLHTFPWVLVWQQSWEIHTAETGARAGCYGAGAEWYFNVPTPCTIRKKLPKANRFFAQLRIFRLFRILHFSCFGLFFFWYFFVFCTVSAAAFCHRNLMLSEGRASECLKKDIHNMVTHEGNDMNHRSTTRSGCEEHAKSWMTQVDDD